MSKNATINLIGSIGSDAFSEISLRTVMAQVEAVKDADHILININSPGGEVTEGFAIYNYLTSLPNNITTRGVGLVASIATVVFLAGKKRELYPNTQFLIHNPWTYGEGDAATLERKADELRSIENTLLDFYTTHTGIDKTQLQDLMNSDKMINADAALELNFATTILTPVKAFATIKTKSSKNTTMSKIGKIFREAFTALKAQGVVLSEMVTTTDGTELEIEMKGSTIAVGDMVMVEGEAADGTFELADGTTIVVSEGTITEVTKPEAGMKESEDEDEYKNITTAELQTQIDALVNENNRLAAENAEMAKNVEVITAHLKKLKINAAIPANAPQFNKVAPDAKKEMTTDEIKTRFRELQNKTKNKTTLAI